MDSLVHSTMTIEQRRQLEEIYRQHISAIRALARLLGYPCPIAPRAERQRAIDDRGTLDTEHTAVWSSGSSSGS